VRVAPALRGGALVEARQHPQQTGPVGQALPCPGPGVEECKKRGIEAKRIVVLETGESWHYYK